MKNSYDIAVENNLLAKKWNDKLYEIFEMIDACKNENAIVFEIKELENLTKNVLANEGLSGVFKHYCVNINGAIETYKNSDSNVTLSDLDSEALIYISSKIDEIIKDTK